jgi:hypothetical protein
MQVPYLVLGPTYPPYMSGFRSRESLCGVRTRVMMRSCGAVRFESTAPKGKRCKRNRVHDTE